MAFNWVYFLRITLLILLIAAIVTACFTLPVEKVPFFHPGHLAFYMIPELYFFLASLLSTCVCMYVWFF